MPPRSGPSGHTRFTGLSAGEDDTMPNQVGTSYVWSIESIAA